MVGRKDRFEFDDSGEDVSPRFGGFPTHHERPKSQQVNEHHEYSLLRSGVVGAIGELKASVWLLEQGYEVYRAVSPHSSSDLVVVKDGEMFAVEVRTAHRHKDGKSFSVDKKISRHATTHVRLLAYVVEWDEFRWV